MMNTGNENSAAPQSPPSAGDFSLQHAMAHRRPRRAGSYAWRLLILFPAAAALAFGYWHYTHIPPGGSVTAVKLTVKPGPVGQVREAYDSVKPSTPDLYLKLFISGREIQTPTREDTPIGNGLTWNLEAPLSVTDFRRVEVWDDGTFGDKQLDNINFEGWASEGQTFHIDLVGEHPRPPDWALPLVAASATLCGVILLRFVWDQVL